MTQKTPKQIVDKMWIGEKKAWHTLRQNVMMAGGWRCAICGNSPPENPGTVVFLEPVTWPARFNAAVASEKDWQIVCTTCRPNDPLL